MKLLEVEGARAFLPVLNPVVVIPGLRAGNCAVLRGSLLIVSV